MSIEVRPFGHADEEMLALYASVPQRLEVRSVYRVNDGDAISPGLMLREVPEPGPWVKDYRSHEDEIVASRRFTCAHNSSFFLALEGDEPVGGASGIRHCEDAEYYCMTDGRPDVAVLRDIRVTEAHQGRGVGRRLFEAVADWARQEQMRYLKIETQNINVPACKFYQHMGARLGGVQRHAYDGENADEVMLLWYLEL